MANNKNYYRRKPAAQKLPQNVEGNPEVLNRPVESLELNEPTLTLIKNNNINLIIDLARRTERDMFRIQTFSKKHLNELRNKLRPLGIDFYHAEEKLPQERNATKSEGDSKRASQPERAQPKRDRNDNFPQQQRQNNARPRVEQKSQPQRNVLLPLGEWRKVNKNGKWGFNDGLKTVIEPIYDEVFLFKEDLACVEIDEKCGFINSEGELVIPIMYDCAMSFSEGLASIVINGKCGYINKNNEIVIEPIYDAATAFENGRAKVKVEGKWGTISATGEIVWNK